MLTRTELPIALRLLLAGIAAITWLPGCSFPPSAAQIRQTYAEHKDEFKVAAEKLMFDQHDSATIVRKPDGSFFLKGQLDESTLDLCKDLMKKTSMYEIKKTPGHYPAGLPAEDGTPPGVFFVMAFQELRMGYESAQLWYVRNGFIANSPLHKRMDSCFNKTDNCVLDNSWALTTSGGDCLGDPLLHHYWGSF
jgi:hypothetical protein